MSREEVVQLLFMRSWPHKRGSNNYWQMSKAIKEKRDEIHYYH